MLPAIYRLHSATGWRLDPPSCRLSKPLAEVFLPHAQQAPRVVQSEPAYCPVYIIRVGSVIIPVITVFLDRYNVYTVESITLTLLVIYDDFLYYYPSLNQFKEVMGVSI